MKKPFCDICGEPAISDMHQKGILLNRLQGSKRILIECRLSFKLCGENEENPDLCTTCLQGMAEEIKEGFLGQVK